MKINCLSKNLYMYYSKRKKEGKKMYMACFVATNRLHFLPILKEFNPRFTSIFSPFLSVSVGVDNLRIQKW